MDINANVGIDINQYNMEGLCRDQNKVYKLKEVKEMPSLLFKRQRTFQSIFMAGMGITRLSTQYSFSKYS